MLQLERVNWENRKWWLENRIFLTAGGITATSREKIWDVSIGTRGGGSVELEGQGGGRITCTCRNPRNYIRRDVLERLTVREGLHL